MPPTPRDISIPGPIRPRVRRIPSGRATDTYRDAAYPTYLYFNPYDEPKDVAVEMTDGPVDLYDTVSNRFLRRNVQGRAYVTLPADTPVVLVLTPADGRLTRSGEKALVDGVVIDYRND